MSEHSADYDAPSCRHCNADVRLIGGVWMHVHDGARWLHCRQRVAEPRVTPPAVGDRR